MTIFGTVQMTLKALVCWDLNKMAIIGIVQIVSVAQCKIAVTPLLIYWL